MFWRVDPDPSDLPALRSSSDLAWGFWNRIAGPGNVQSIKYFLSTSVVNAENEKVIIPRVLETMSGFSRSPRAWPGTEVKPNAKWAEEQECFEALVGTLPIACGEIRISR